MYAGCFSVSIIHRTLDRDYRIFNVHTGVNACDCTQGCMDTVRESLLKIDSGRKIPCRTRESNLHRWRDGPMLYQLSYIPTCACGSSISTFIPKNRCWVAVLWQCKQSLVWCRWLLAALVTWQSVSGQLAQPLHSAPWCSQWSPCWCLRFQFLDGSF